MINIEYLDVYGFETAIRAMRNPKNSWKNSDSTFKDGKLINIGPNDFDLMKRLFKGGTEHRKYLRQIYVSFDLSAMVYYLAEFDTYKVGVTRNSCSFMHKGVSKSFEITDFSNHNDEVENIIKNDIHCYDPDLELEVSCWRMVLKTLNKLRDKYLETKDPDIFLRIRDILPSGYNQRATFSMNYENIINMIRQRKDHRIPEWREFCQYMIDNLPLLKELLED